MEVFRITLPKWANSLTASGRPARWSPNGRFVVYTAASRALACLENVVHRSGEGLSEHFRVMVIEIPDGLKMEKIALGDLPENWAEFENYPLCQKIGGQWLAENGSAVLEVPSAIVPMEKNFLLNPAHPDFSKIRIIATEGFSFDPRIKT